MERAIIFKDVRASLSLLGVKVAEERDHYLASSSLQIQFHVHEGLVSTPTTDPADDIRHAGP
ncbi:MAG TPA: hypothetical protein VNH38_02035 [Candidatus Dormibacteraeota bacterium]|nr:hypothetical protein [Candidatus Dormibacteraeota bacterium]